MKKMEKSWINIIIEDVQQLWPIIQNSYDVWDIEDRVLPDENTIKHYLQNHLSQDIKKIRTRLFTWEANRHYMQKEENKNIIPTYQCDLCEHFPYKKPGILALHKIQEHNVYPESHYYINTHWCPICMHDFESIVRVREHIDQIHHPDKIGHVSCFDIMKKEYTKLTEEQLEQVKIDVKSNKASQKQKQVRERKAHSISRRSEGPIPPEIDQFQFQFQPANEDSES